MSTPSSQIPGSGAALRHIAAAASAEGYPATSRPEGAAGQENITSSSSLATTTAGRHAHTNSPTQLPPNDESEDWGQHKACKDVDPELFFPERDPKGDPKSRAYRAQVKRAVAVCNLCVVSAQCLLLALDHNATHGVWGGTTARQRRTIKARPELVAQTKADAETTAAKLKADKEKAS